MSQTQNGEHVVPWWLRGDPTAMVASPAGWRHLQLLPIGSGGRYAYDNGDDHHIDMCLGPVESPGDIGGHGWRLDVTVRPGSVESFAGVQILMPLLESMRCSWKPHLAPMPSMAVGDKAFRSPAVILENEETLAAFVPDVLPGRVADGLPHIMDYVDQPRHLMYGLSDYIEVGHVYYELRPTPLELTEPLKFGAWLWSWPKSPECRSRDFRPVERLLWEQLGSREMADPPQLEDLQPFVGHAYEWAFGGWESVAWQDFPLPNGEHGGGVAAIINAKQKPGLGQETCWREPKALWNQAWFSTMRTAYGCARWGKGLDRPVLLDRARQGLEVTLAAPQTNGLFPSCLMAQGDTWDSAEWLSSSPRRPPGLESYVHLLDASWTCYWLLCWYRDVEADPRILEYVDRYTQRLLSLQESDGSFPAWVRPHDLKSSAYLAESPETSMHAVLLCMVAGLIPNARLVPAARLAVDFVVKHTVLTGRWEDFETYWSCAGEWEGRRYGEIDPRSGLFNQCNFGIFLTAEALKSVHVATGERRFLDLGRQVMAELSLYQQIWQPKFFSVPTLGGFGVMNSDDEWNDARSSLFARTYLDYYRLTGELNYLHRGLWAMASSFTMMYCPENEAVKGLYDRTHPFFDERDFGFQVENFNHHDGTDEAGFAQFAIFDWGAGSASATLAELVLGSNPG